MERAAPSARAPELAVVRGQDRGLGVYLSPHTVITPARLVGDAKVLDAEVQGVLVPALVAARDPALDLALLKLPRAGYPARVDDAGAGPGQRLRIQTSATTGGEARVVEVANGARVLHLKLAPGTDPAIGAPIFGGDRLVGLVVAVEGEEARAVSGSAIDALLDQLQDSDLLLD